METKFLNLSPEYLLNSTYTVFTYGRYTITFPKGIPDFDMFDNPNITKEIKILPIGDIHIKLGYFYDKLTVQKFVPELFIKFSEIYIYYITVPWIENTIRFGFNQFDFKQHNKLSKKGVYCEIDNGCVICIKKPMTVVNDIEKAKLSGSDIIYENIFIPVKSEFYETNSDFINITMEKEPQFVLNLNRVIINNYEWIPIINVNNNIYEVAYKKNNRNKNH